MTHVNPVMRDVLRKRMLRLKYDGPYAPEAYWTRVCFTDNAVSFSLGRNHYAGAVFGAAMFTAFFAGMFFFSVGDRIWFVSMFLALFPFQLHAGL